MSCQLSKVQNPSNLFFKAFAEILNQLLQFLESFWVTFATTLGEHPAMAASVNMSSIAIDYKNKAIMKVAASN